MGPLPGAPLWVDSALAGRPGSARIVRLAVGSELIGAGNPENALQPQQLVAMPRSESSAASSRRGSGAPDAHWDVIRFMREYYEEHQIAPDARPRSRRARSLE